MSLINLSPRSNKRTSDSEHLDDKQDEQWMLDLRRKRDLQVTGKPKPTQHRNLERLKYILKSEGFQMRGNRLLIEREEATFEVDLKMGNVQALQEGKEPLILCVTQDSTPWANIEDLADFDLFLLSIIYLLAREKLPESITEQLEY